MSTVGPTLDLLLSHLGYAKRHPALWAMAAWQSAAGEAVARHAVPERVQGATLHVVVDSAVWAHELRFLEGGLVVKLNQAAGRRSVEGLRYRIGRLPERESYDPSPSRAVAERDLPAGALDGWPKAADAEVDAAWRRLVAAGFCRMDQGGSSA